MVGKGSLPLSTLHKNTYTPERLEAALLLRQAPTFHTPTPPSPTPRTKGTHPLFGQRYTYRFSQARTGLDWAGLHPPPLGCVIPDGAHFTSPASCVTDFFSLLPLLSWNSGLGRRHSRLKRLFPNPLLDPPRLTVLEEELPFCIQQLVWGPPLNLPAAPTLELPLSRYFEGPGSSSASRWSSYSLPTSASYLWPTDYS
ncbi:hypothetical protein LX32DRAFT_330961 [Colletotrichum zoysiae]|uniref:Uncharacterized protein n=1 Tax=Colletotrichum zoysiae TaxID=1216348 RepID=A0AAD9M173_9PEZI|nr:hypothetical protein LX32DRAFT_330961 [Colletotrichum zoysiae]